MIMRWIECLLMTGETADRDPLEYDYVGWRCPQRRFRGCRRHGGTGGAARPEARRLHKQEAVRQAVQAELQRMTAAIPLRERIAAWRKEHKLPPPTGQVADKAFFDELSGEP